MAKTGRAVAYLGVKAENSLGYGKTLHPVFLLIANIFNKRISAIHGLIMSKISDSHRMIPLLEAASPDFAQSRA